MAMSDLFEDLSSAGSDVLDAVTDALNTNDFSGVSPAISEAVDDFINDIKAETYGANAQRARKTSGISSRVALVRTETRASGA